MSDDQRDAADEVHEPTGVSQQEWADRRAMQSDADTENETVAASEGRAELPLRILLAVIAIVVSIGALLFILQGVFATGTFV